MSWPNIAKCYDEIVEDPSLLWLFLEKECPSLWELPLLGTLWFRLILERLFAHIASPDMWGGLGEFITCTGWKISTGTTPMAILITDGVGEGNLGMVTTFCHHDQAKMEAPDSLSALHQCDLPEPSMVVVRRYTNTPYIPQGTSHFLYLDMSTLSGCTSSAQFPLDWLLWLLYAGCCLSLRLRWSCLVKRGVGLKVYPHSWEVLWKSPKRNTASLTQFHCQSPHLLSFLIKNRVLRQRKNWAITQPSSNCKISIKQGFSWNASWVKRYRSWPKDMTIVRSSWLRNMRRSKRGWPKREMPPFKKSFLWWIQQIQ